MAATRFILQGLALITGLAVLAWLLGDVLDRHWIDEYVRDRGVMGELLFVGVGGLLTSIGLSRQLIAFLAGYGFGFSVGVLLSMVAVILGCMITFYIARLLLRAFLLSHYGARIHKLDGFIRGHTFTTTLLFRLLPVGNNWMVNIAAGASAVRSVPFFLGSALGYIPQMLIFALVGSGSQLQEFWQVAIAMAMFVVAGLLGAWLFARYRRLNRMNAKPGEDPQDSSVVHRA